MDFDKLVGMLCARFRFMSVTDAVVRNPRSPSISVVVARMRSHSVSPATMPREQRLDSVPHHSSRLVILGGGAVSRGNLAGEGLI